MNSDIAPLLVSGIIRSGTTLLSRILNAHPQMSVYADPYSGFFIELRNEIGRALEGDDFDPNKPLSHGFCETDLSLKRHLRDCSLDVPIPPSRLPAVLDRVRSFALENVPALEQELESINAENFLQLFEQLLDALRRVTPENVSHDALRYVGFKQAWAEELLSPAIVSNSKLKIVHIIRDPRAVIASRKKGAIFLSHRYPLLFILRHWRKSVAYALYLQHRFPKQFVWLRYEELVSQPDETARRLCDFLEIEFVPEMLDVSGFENNNNQPWTDNSAYGGFSTISSESMEKWRKELSEEELQYIEDFTHLELEILKHKRVSEFALSSSAVRNLELDSVDTPWMISYGAENDEGDQRVQRELRRIQAYEETDDQNARMDLDTLESLLIVPEFKSLAREAQKRS